MIAYSSGKDEAILRARNSVLLYVRKCHPVYPHLIYPLSDKLAGHDSWIYWPALWSTNTPTNCLPVQPSCPNKFGQ